ncbi:phage late control D family protein [Mangrovibacter sp. SLW1]
MVHGVITHFTRTGGSADEAKYSIVLEPFIALLANQFRTHRFFVNKSVPEVVAEVLQEHNLNGWEYEFLLSHDYPKREQINQYQENDLAFIERLLAELGIFTSSACTRKHKPKWCTLPTGRAPGHSGKNCR